MSQKLSKEQLIERLANDDVAEAKPDQLRRWALEHRKKIYRDTHTWSAKDLNRQATARCLI